MDDSLASAAPQFKQTEAYFLQAETDLLKPLNVRNEAAAISLLLPRLADAGAQWVWRGLVGALQRVQGGRLCARQAVYGAVWSSALQCGAVCATQVRVQRRSVSGLRRTASPSGLSSSLETSTSAGRRPRRRPSQRMRIQRVQQQALRGERKGGGRPGLAALRSLSRPACMTFEEPASSAATSYSGDCKSQAPSCGMQVGGGGRHWRRHPAGHLWWAAGVRCGARPSAWRRSAQHTRVSADL